MNTYLSDNKIKLLVYMLKTALSIII